MAPEKDRAPAEKPETARHCAVALRWAGVGVVAVMLFAAPLAFGAVERWAWGALWFTAALAAAIALAVWVAEGRVSVIFAPVLALSALLAVVALVQLVPLPSRALSLAGERTAAVYKVLFGGIPERISLAPGATVEAFFKITLVAMAVFATLALVRTRAMLFTLVGASILAALVAAGVGIIQEKGHGEKIYGLRDIRRGAQTHFRRSALLDPALSSGIGHVESVKDENGAVFFQQSVNIGDVFGPYADSNHFGGLMEIVLPVVLALLAALLAARRSGWGEEGGFTATPEGGLALLLLFALFVGVGATVYCGSAGALGALAAGFGVVLVVMLLTRQAGAAAVVLCVVLATGALLAVPWSRSDLYDRLLAKIGGRAAVWETTRQAATDFPVVGSGLGTYAYVIPHYEHTEERHLFAHNDYLQLAMEGGL
ncbi:MAG: O-antigen ligase family protein, partial [Planctomycetes bacterium]|nr:O-antigen ligase family protein [Planctomycetota bacterium]